MKLSIRNISISDLYGSKSVRNTRRRRVIAASLYCLFAFFARYSVHYGHDCDQINPWQKNETSQVAVTISKMEHCRVHGAGDDAKKHDHEDCQVCHSYDELVKSVFEKFSPTVDMQLTGVEIVSESEAFTPFSEQHSSFRPRGPPSIQTV